MGRTSRHVGRRGRIDRIDGIPEDARAAGVEASAGRQAVVLYLESAAFDPVAPMRAPSLLRGPDVRKIALTHEQTRSTRGVAGQASGCPGPAGIIGRDPDSDAGPGSGCATRASVASLASSSIRKGSMNKRVCDRMMEPSLHRIVTGLLVALAVLLSPASSASAQIATGGQSIEASVRAGAWAPNVYATLAGCGALGDSAESPSDDAEPTPCTLNSACAHEADLARAIGLDAPRGHAVELRWSRSPRGPPAPDGVR